MPDEQRLLPVTTVTCLDMLDATMEVVLEVQTDWGLGEKKALRLLAHVHTGVEVYSSEKLCQRSGVQEPCTCNR